MSSGKVKCTCGWSWNKSDSSKKDMYICHECGRDNSNNMKNGGWLDSYADGGTMQEHQENYNDPQVSLPEGFVGMGNNTKGRNYSPAWGGQFQNGGKTKSKYWTEKDVPAANWKKFIKQHPGAIGMDPNRTDKNGYHLPIYAKSKNDPIYVESKNDPRYKAYQDSLTLSSRPSDNPGRIMSIQEWEKNHNKGDASRYKEKGIMPIGMKDLSQEPYIRSEPVFKRPQQQVKVKPKPITPVANNLKLAGLVNDDLEIDSTNFPELRPQVRPVKDWKYIWKHAGSTEWGHVNSPEDMDKWVDWRDWYSTGGGKDKGDSVEIIPVYQTGGYLKKEIKKTERDLLKKYVAPTQARALTRAKQQGINTGSHNGPLDAIRHSSSAAAMSSILPSWANFIPGVAPINMLATNIAGAAHELNSPNTLKEHASDLYNNFIGSAVGVLPISEESKHDLLIQAQKHGVLSDMGDKTPLRKRPAAPQLAQPILAPLISKKEMGGSIPGATGRFYARYEEGGKVPGDVGFDYPRTINPAPDNGPGAKKTMASAQNGQEMKYYQEGLDFKPKTISKNGGWLDSYDVAQTGTQVKYGTPEYEEAYNRGEVITDEGGRSPILLDEVVVQNNYKRNFWERYRDKIIEENKDASPLGAILGGTTSAVFSLPQLAMMDALTGKTQRPSEAMDIQNPIGALAIDAITDPTNLIGAGILTKEKALARLSNLKNINAEGKIFSGMNNELNNMAIRNTKNYMAKRTPSNTPLPKELEPYISRIGEPSISREEEVFRNVMGTQYREAKELQNTKFLDSEGNLISNPNTSQQQFYQGDIPATDRPIQKDGGVIKDDMGYWNPDNWDSPVEIGSNEITMKHVPFDVLGISDTGDTKLMKPGKNYKFKGKKVTEFRMAKNGIRQEQKGLVNLDNLINFTNYNTKQPGGWLDNYN